MNKLDVKKYFVNKRLNTYRIKYEALLEENKAKNEKIIDIYGDLNEAKNKNEELQKDLITLGSRITLYKNDIELLKEKVKVFEHDPEIERLILEAKAGNWSIFNRITVRRKLIAELEKIYFGSDKE